MTSKLKETLRLHALWLRGDSAGKRADLYGASLSEADLYGAKLCDVELTAANLSRAGMGGADLRRADLSRADLSEADLIAANLRWADLRDANLYGADLTAAKLIGAKLSGAKLSGADLRWTRGNDREIKNVETDRWWITYTAEVMAIGCEQHAIAEWFDFDDDTIAKMDKRALKWWREWKPKLQQIIADDPAVKTGWEELCLTAADKIEEDEV